MTETVFISARDKLWSVHTEAREIGKLSILKSTAISAAVKYVSNLPEGSCKEIKVQKPRGAYYTYWELEKDSYPPSSKPHH